MRIDLIDEIQFVSTHPKDDSQKASAIVDDDLRPKGM